MKPPLDFYFDFSSPYGYLMSEKIDDLAARHERKVRWRPILLGPVFKATGAAPLTEVPLKGDYSKRDFARSARFLGVPFALPAKFPVATQHAARAYYWQHGRACQVARQFAHAVFRACFAEGRDISALDTVLDIAAAQGMDRALLAEALAGDELRERLREAVANAIERGVFGSPYVIVDNEPFMGVDRLPQIEQWLAGGGF